MTKIENLTEVHAGFCACPWGSYRVTAPGMCSLEVLTQ